MPDIPDLQAEIIARTLLALKGQIPEATFAEIVRLAERGELLVDGALQTVLLRGATNRAANAD